MKTPIEKLKEILEEMNEIGGSENLRDHLRLLDEMRGLIESEQSRTEDCLDDEL